jgi:hypothetical protein
MGNGAESGSKRFKLDFGNAEGYEADYIVAFDVTTTSAGTNFAMAPEYVQDTNYEMFVWGCDFATDPNTRNSSGGGAGGQSQSNNFVDMPNLIGYARDVIEGELQSAGYNFTVTVEYVQDIPSSNCKMGLNQVGVIVDQNIAPGTQVDNTPGRTFVTLLVDCTDGIDHNQ